MQQWVVEFDGPPRRSARLATVAGEASGSGCRSPPLRIGGETLTPQEQSTAPPTTFPAAKAPPVGSHSAATPPIEPDPLPPHRCATAITPIEPPPPRPPFKEELYVMGKMSLKKINRRWTMEKGILIILYV